VELVSNLLDNTRNISSGVSFFGMTMKKYCLLNHHFVVTIYKIRLKWQKSETTFMKHKITFKVSS